MYGDVWRKEKLVNCPNIELDNIVYAKEGEKLRKIVDKFKVNSLTICSVGFCLMDISIYQATIDLTGERLHTLNLNVDNLYCGILCGMLN